MTSESSRTRHNTTGDAWSLPALLALLLVQLWAAHALAFFAHEYAHSFVAWSLGWKSNPLALDYARPTLTVLLLQFGINQNVDEIPIFASHHDAQAALISGAGMLLGNGLMTLPLSRWMFHRARRHSARAAGMFWYWTTVASLGNLIDYVPVRTFTDGTDLYQDMYAVERGLHCSPWLLLLCLGMPVAIVTAVFLFRTEPQTLRWLFPKQGKTQCALAVLTAFVLFDFYGAAGWSDSGAISHRLSVISVLIVAPLAAVLGCVLVRGAGDPEQHSKR